MRIEVFNLIILIVSLGLVFLFLGTMAYGAILAAPYLPSRKRDIHRALKLAGVRDSDHVYDLGSGDGRFIIAASKDFGAKSTGFEIAFLPYIISKINIHKLGLHEKTKVYMKNFFRADLSGADVMIIFLMPKALGKLGEKLKKELKPGTRVVTCAWHIPGWTPEAVDKPSQRDFSMFLYRI